MTVLSPFSLNDKTALVTGAARGLGKGIALQLAGAGANIIVADLLVESAQSVADEIVAMGGQAMAVSLDVTEDDAINHAVKLSREQFSRIDLLINNAGVMQQGFGELTTANDFDHCYTVNLKGVWQVCRAIKPGFIEQKAGKIVNIASMAGRRGHGFSPAYCASKAAVISLTQSLATELGPFNINVNAICPGLIWTDMWQQIDAANNPATETHNTETSAFIGGKAMTALKRAQTVEDIGNAVIFFCTEASRNITGQALNVDGGIFMN